DLLEPLEHVLHLPSAIREVAVSELVDANVDFAHAYEERVGGSLCLVAAGAARRKHHPGDVESRDRSRERQERASASDLDVVCMAADREHSLERSVSGGEREPEHQERGWGCRLHGARPPSRSASSFCLSLMVSIGSQNPSYG